MRAAIRFCSAIGGKGITADATLSLLRLSTVAPDAFCENWSNAYFYDNNQYK